MGRTRSLSFHLLKRGKESFIVLETGNGSGFTPYKSLGPYNKILDPITACSIIAAEMMMDEDFRNIFIDYK